MGAGFSRRATAYRPREIGRPLRARPGRAEVRGSRRAAHPQLRERLVTAAELDRSGRRGDLELGRGYGSTPRAAAARRLAARDSSGPRLRFLSRIPSLAFVRPPSWSGTPGRHASSDRLFGGTPPDAAEHLAIEIPSAPRSSQEPPAGARPPNGQSKRARRTGRSPRGARLDVPVMCTRKARFPKRSRCNSGGQRAVIAPRGSRVRRSCARAENVEITRPRDDTDSDPTAHRAAPADRGNRLFASRRVHGLRSARSSGEAEVLAGSRIFCRSCGSANATARRGSARGRVVDSRPRRPAARRRRPQNRATTGFPSPSPERVCATGSSSRRGGLTNPTRSSSPFGGRDRERRSRSSRTDGGDFATVPGADRAAGARTRRLDRGMSFTRSHLRTRPPGTSRTTCHGAWSTPAPRGRSRRRSPRFGGGRRPRRDADRGRRGSGRSSPFQVRAPPSDVVALARTRIERRRSEETRERCRRDLANGIGFGQPEPNAREGRSAPLRGRIVSPAALLRPSKTLACARIAASSLSSCSAPSSGGR